jgi:hypothetical protein
MTMQMQLQRQRGDGSGSRTARRARQITPTTRRRHPACWRSARRFVAEWLSRDPIQERGGNNLYNFVHNNPACVIDPDGRLWWLPFVPLLFLGCSSDSCTCDSVTVDFTPGGSAFQWGWVPGPTPGVQRYGNNMHVVWKVKGNSKKCKYSQIEIANFSFHNLTDVKAQTRYASWEGQDIQIDSNHGSFGNETREYIDVVGNGGSDFVSPQDDGDWIIVGKTPPSITLKCTSSNGKTKTASVTVPNPDGTMFHFPPTQQR